MWDLNRLISILKRWRKNQSFCQKRSKLPWRLVLASPQWKKRVFVGYLTYWPYLPLLFLPKKGVKTKKELFFQKNLPDFIDKTINQASPIWPFSYVFKLQSASKWSVRSLVRPGESKCTKRLLCFLPWWMTPARDNDSKRWWYGVFNTNETNEEWWWINLANQWNEWGGIGGFCFFQCKMLGCEIYDFYVARSCWIKFKKGKLATKRPGTVHRLVFLWQFGPCFLSLGKFSHCKIQNIQTISWRLDSKTCWLFFGSKQFGRELAISKHPQNTKPLWNCTSTCCLENESLYLNRFTLLSQEALHFVPDLTCPLHPLHHQ